MSGEGSYTYKKTADIYSGTWANNKKEGEGRYEFGSDQSIFVGVWVNGEMNSGTWELQGAGKFEGKFKVGRPFGEGKFSLDSGISQEGEYVQVKVEGEDDEPAEGAAPKPPNVVWKGQSIVSFY